MERIGELFEQLGKVFFVGRIELFPINDYTGSLGITQHHQHVGNEFLLPLGRTMCHIFDRFRLPGIADQIGQERHERDPFVLRQFRNARVRIDLQITHPIHHRHPFRTNVGDLRGVLLERGVAIGIAVGIEGQPHLVVWRFATRPRGCGTR